MAESIHYTGSIRQTKPKQIDWLSRYWAYCDRQMKQRTLWYLLPLMSLSAAVMPIGIFLMSYFTWYLSFVAISILLFFANIVVNIAGQHTRTTITIYLITLLVHVLAPLLSFLLSK